MGRWRWKGVEERYEIIEHASYLSTFSMLVVSFFV